MTVPAPREPQHGRGRWDAVITALDSWPRTARLCVILLVGTAASSGVVTGVAELVMHVR